MTEDQAGAVRRRIIAEGAHGIESLFARWGRVAEDMRPEESPHDYVGRKDAVIEENVRAMAEVLASQDAFDVLDLMRQRESPVTLTGYRESQADGMAAAIEIVALILLARGDRKPEDDRPAVDPPNSLISDLHRRCSTLLTMGTFAALAEGEQQKYGPLTKLAFEYRSHEVNVRFKQYAHIHDQFNLKLFGAETGGVVADALGFDCEGFESVRDSIQEIYADKLGASLDDLGEVAQE